MQAEVSSGSDCTIGGSKVDVVKATELGAEDGASPRSLNTSEKAMPAISLRKVKIEDNGGHVGRRCASDGAAGSCPSAGHLPARSVKTTRFRDWKTMAIELAVVILGFYVLNVTTVGTPAISGITGTLVGIVALWLILLELPGISINSETISMPAYRISWLPILSFWRKTVLLSDVRRLTVSASWAGFEVLRMSRDFGSETLVFASKGQRRRFIALVRSISGDIAIFRSR